MIARGNSKESGGDKPAVEKIVWSAHETAAHLGVSVRTVWRLKAEHGLPFSEIGGRIKFIPSDVEQYCRDRRKVTTADSA